MKSSDYLLWGVTATRRSVNNGAQSANDAADVPRLNTASAFATNISTRPTRRSKTSLEDLYQEGSGTRHRKVVAGLSSNLSFQVIISAKPYDLPSAAVATYVPPLEDVGTGRPKVASESKTQVTDQPEARQEKVSTRGVSFHLRRAGDHASLASMCTTAARSAQVSNMCS